MKNYKETTDSIFDKSEQIIEVGRKRKKTIAGISGPLCACAILVVSIGIWRGGQVDIPVVPSDNTSQVAENNQVHNNSSGNESDNMPAPTVEANIFVNELSGATNVAAMDIGLMVEDEISKTPEELQEYYGTEIYPTELPDGFRKEMLMDDGGVYGHFSIFQREDRGVYYDQNTIVYVSEAAMSEYERLGYLNWTEPTILITVSKTREIFWDTVISELTEAPLQTSTISGNELIVCRYENQSGEHYVAYFTKDDVNFEIDGNLISEEEFTALLVGYFTE